MRPKGGGGCEAPRKDRRQRLEDQLLGMTVSLDRGLGGAAVTWHQESTSVLRASDTFGEPFSAGNVTR